MSSTGIITGVVMLLVCVGMVVLPFLRQKRQGVTMPDKQATQQYDNILLDLAMLEDDYRQGYYSEADYSLRRNTLRQQAIHILQELDASTNNMNEQGTSDAIEQLITSYRQQEHSQ